MKKLVLKICLAVLLVGAGQVAVGNLVEKRDFPKRDEIDAEIAGGADLLILGDSVMKYTYKTDPDQRKLRDMLREGLAPRKVAIVDGPAYGAEMYLDIVEYVLRRGVQPRAIILPVNLRSFSLLWDRMPHYQYAAERARLRWGDTFAFAVNRPLGIYNVYSRLEGYPSSEKEHQRLPAYRGTEMMGTLQEVLGGSGKWGSVPWNERAFSLIYLYPLDPDHRKIRALQRLADLCRSRKIPLLAYVTPIDVDGGTRAMGPEFRQRVSANIAVISKGLAESGVALLDLSFAVKGSLFDWNPFPNEHLKDTGRRWLSEQLIGRLKAGGF
jgi:hypothetical protein